MISVDRRQRMGLGPSATFQLQDKSSSKFMGKRMLQEEAEEVLLLSRFRQATPSYGDLPPWRHFSTNPNTKKFWTNPAEEKFRVQLHGDKFSAEPAMGKVLAKVLREKKSGTCAWIHLLYLYRSHSRRFTWFLVSGIPFLLPVH